MDFSFLFAFYTCSLMKDIYITKGDFRMGALFIGLVMFLASLGALIVFMSMSTKVELAKIEKGIKKKDSFDE